MLRPYMVFPLCPSLMFYPCVLITYKDNNQTGFRAHLNPQASDLNYLLKGSVSKYIHNLRHCGLGLQHLNLGDIIHNKNQMHIYLEYLRVIVNLVGETKGSSGVRNYFKSGLHTL